MEKLKIATRKSVLAMWQSEHIRDKILSRYPELAVELTGMKNLTDRKSVV